MHTTEKMVTSGKGGWGSNKLGKGVQCMVMEGHQALDGDHVIEYVDIKL